MWLLENAPPRCLRAKPSERPAVVFVDGAVADQGCGRVIIGAVLISPRSVQWHYFGCEVPDDITMLWRAGGSRQVIGQAEVLPILAAKLTWPQLLRNTRVLFFVDNESARFAMIRAGSPVDTTRQLLLQSFVADWTLNCLCWFARVPTCANLADEPSRLTFGRLESAHAVRHEPSLPSAVTLTSGAVEQQLEALARS